MKVLVACEESQAVCIEFRKLGHEAYSCDILEPSGGHPEWHIKGDVLSLIDGDCTFITLDGTIHSVVGEWDMLLAFPPCTDLASSGARWFPEKQKDFRQQKSVVFFMRFILARCEKIAVENPIGIMSTVYRKPDQIIQPWQYGHGETKSTCLWLKGLPLLQPTKIVEGREPRVWLIGSGHAKERSKTYLGIAKAMAEQWAGKAEET